MFSIPSPRIGPFCILFLFLERLVQLLVAVVPHKSVKRIALLALGHLHGGGGHAERRDRLSTPSQDVIPPERSNLTMEMKVLLARLCVTQCYLDMSSRKDRSRFLISPLTPSLHSSQLVSQFGRLLAAQLILSQPLRCGVVHGRQDRREYLHASRATGHAVHTAAFRQRAHWPFFPHVPNMLPVVAVRGRGFAEE